LSVTERFASSVRVSGNAAVTAVAGTLVGFTADGAGVGAHAEIVVPTIIRTISPTKILRWFIFILGLICK
jgi:hypothetical protein